MRIDFFELIEGLIKGVVYFLYNLLETGYWVVRHPFRGPRHLFRRNRYSGDRQLSGITFLFVTFFLAHALLLALIASGANRVSTEMGDQARLSLNWTLLAYADIDAGSWWPVLLASLASTAVVDFPLRLVLKWRFPRDRRKRERTLATTEYALFGPILIYLLLAAWFVVEAARYILSGGQEAFSPAAGAGILALFLATLPAALHFAYPDRRIRRWAPPIGRKGAAARREPWPPRLSRSSLRTVGIPLLGLATLVVAAMSAGASAGMEAFLTGVGVAEPVASGPDATAAIPSRKHP